jgi:hypothetical protein
VKEKIIMDQSTVNDSLEKMKKELNLRYVRGVSDYFLQVFSASKKNINKFLSKQSVFCDLDISNIDFETNPVLLMNKINYLSATLCDYGYECIFIAYNKDEKVIKRYLSIEQLISFDNKEFDLMDSLKLFIKNDLSRMCDSIECVRLIKDLFSVLSKDKKNIEESNKDSSGLELTLSTDLIDFLKMGHYGVDEKSCFNFQTGGRRGNKYNIACMPGSFMVVLRKNKDIIARCIGVMTSKQRWDFFNWYGKDESSIVKLFKSLLMCIGIVTDKDLIYSYNKFNFKNKQHLGSNDLIYINKNTFSISTKDPICEYMPDLNIDMYDELEV